MCYWFSNLVDLTKFDFESILKSKIRLTQNGILNLEKENKQKNNLLQIIVF